MPRPSSEELDQRRRLLEDWWGETTPRRKLALVRIEGEMFGIMPDRSPTNADYSAKCRAVAQLIAMALKRGLRLSPEREKRTLGQADLLTRADRERPGHDAAF